MAQISVSRQQLLRDARAVADSLDALSMSLLSKDEQRTQDALSDLVATYDTYADRSQAGPGRLGFDETGLSAGGESSQARGDTALLKALTDLRLATALGLAGEAVELGTAERAADLADSSVELSQAFAEVERAQDVLGGHLGFDEGGGQAPADSGSGATREQVRGLAVELYDLLISETAELLGETLGSFGKDDPQKVRDGLEQSARTLDRLSGEPVATRVLGAVRSAIATLSEIIGPEGLKDLGARVDKTLDELRKGGDAMLVFLKYSFAYEAGIAEIDSLLAQEGLAPDKLATAQRRLKLLRGDIEQLFRVEHGVVKTVRIGRRPIEWALGKISGTLPFDLVCVAIFALVADIGTLRAQDMSDATTIVRFVEGIRVTSRRALQV